MKMISSTLVLLVAALHFYFLVLEMFLWTHPKGLKAFHNTPEKAQITKTLAANQGLYNGFLAAGLIWGVFHPTQHIGLQIQLFFLLCVCVAGIYGAITVGKKILYIQFLPALIAMLSVFL